LKSGVTASCRYEPGLQRTYSECLAHYGTAGLPARPGKSRDKAKVEAGGSAPECAVAGALCRRLRID
jgi:hypothetical protein